jgi:3-deoxy-D-arabino-heptulosonate 7-phosphate (DAHP) synthase
VLSGGATTTNFIVFGLTGPGLEHTINRTRGEQASHYITRGERASHYITKAVNSMRSSLE